jgi:hypothetical protein
MPDCPYRGIAGGIGVTAWAPASTATGTLGQIDPGGAILGQRPAQALGTPRWTSIGPCSRANMSFTRHSSHIWIRRMAASS